MLLFRYAATGLLLCVGGILGLAAFCSRVQVMQQDCSQQGCTTSSSLKRLATNDTPTAGNST